MPTLSAYITKRLSQRLRDERDADSGATSYGLLLDDPERWMTNLTEARLRFILFGK
jgi:hypothetical protein